jgi:hypothetical protein
MSRNSYALDWAAALNRTSSFGLKVPSMLPPTEERFLTPARIAEFPYVVRRVMGDLTPRDLVGQCMAIHIRLAAVLREWLDCPVHYTIGWVDVHAGKPLFKFDDAFIAEKLANGHDGGPINLHAWLTLPTMEIVDMALATTFAMVQKIEEGLGGVMAGPPDELKGFSYRPMLVGDDFLRKTGILIEGSFFTFGRA